ncbi:MAG: ERAP1-like C-terminal domain-containing protein, partial [Acidobacteria bacterium]|nr:ERAP1-like C-terminal domain-containing protein [Acidobacteriota bacterium]
MAALLVLCPVLALAQTATPGPGIPLAVAETRAARIGDLRYDLRLAVPALVTVPIEGTNTITFDLSAATEPLVIDFATSRDHVTRVTANGRASAFTWIHGHIVVPATALRAGRNTIAIAFRAGDASLNRNADFLYALFVPARAHLAVPVFDQPDLKARWSLTLTAPSHWQMVSNGAEIERKVSASSATVRFADTEPLSTYLFSFVVGDFKVETAARNGRTMRMFHRETDAKKVARNRDAIFDLHARAIEYMERYTNIPYAFGKFDFVAIPAFQFGGMEHAGKILYNASGLLLDESATQNAHLGRASVIAHETAHMWFGDLVTMRWFNDVWMKEVFANFMAAKIVNPSFPEVNHDLRFLLSHYPAAYEVDRTPGANAIRQPLANLNEAGSLYGAIIYQKAPVVMRHLESLIGEEVFRDGLRVYLKNNAFGNATWADLISILDQRTPTDLATWSRVWVETPGRPTITTTLELDGDKITRLAFHQATEHAQQLRIVLGYADKVVPLTATVEGSRVDVPRVIGMAAPLYVLPNGGGWAYGGFKLDPRSRDYLSRSLPDLPDPLTRGAAWVTMWDALLEHEVPATQFVDLAMAALPRETDEQLTGRVLGYLSGAWWRFLPVTERHARVDQLEALLRQGLVTAKTAGQKAQWFGALRNVSATPPTTAWLRRVWEQTETIDGLPLAEADYINLALELAVREIHGWRDVLTTQFGRIENPDRKARFEFVMPALSSDPTERERWFLALADVNNRRREPWVLEGLNYLHHPLRAAASARYVAPSLNLLWEIQKTGDIFFPTRWMNATLSGHTAPEVAATVRNFLATLPGGYPPRLTNIILQTADDLFRVAEAPGGESAGFSAGGGAGPSAQTSGLENITIRAARVIDGRGQVGADQTVTVRGSKIARVGG